MLSYNNLVDRVHQLQNERQYDAAYSLFLVGWALAPNSISTIAGIVSQQIEDLEGEVLTIHTII